MLQYQFPGEAVKDMFSFVAWNEAVPIVHPVVIFFFACVVLLIDVKLPVLMKPFLEIIYTFG